MMNAPTWRHQKLFEILCNELCSAFLWLLVEQAWKELEGKEKRETKGGKIHFVMCYAAYKLLRMALAWGYKADNMQKSIF